MVLKKTADSSKLILSKILFIRNQKIILDTDLADLYGVTTKRLNEQVKRNIERFPVDFVFQLSVDEKQEVVAICDHLKKLKFSSGNPYAFTEHGAIMAASILSSPKAISVSVLVVRTFIKLRRMLSENIILQRKLIELENRLDGHDDHIKALMSAIHELMEMPQSDEKLKIGFESWSDE